LVCVAGPDVVRFLPPLVIEKEHIDIAVEALDEFLS
jgi:acetylornithine/succinyldiaminopimelate/putrescine aminotransferase